MASRESFLTTLRDSLGSFFHTSKKLAAPILEQFGPSYLPAAIDDEDLERLKSKLARIRAALKDAEKFVCSDEAIKLWLRELRELEQSAEDVLERIEFESLRATKFEEFKLELLRSRSGKRKREASFLFLPSVSSLDRKISKIWERYCEISSDRHALRWTDGDGARRPEVCPLSPTSSFPSVQLHGRDKDLEKVTQLLLSDDADHGFNYSVIPVVGMAGVGKTSLVQNIYHSAPIKSKFNLTIWVWVSEVFDTQHATRKMAQEILGFPCDSFELNLLHTKIIERLKGKRFLLVLDDMWDEDQSRWESLRVPLNYGAKGSKIIVTTRSTKVADIMCRKKYHLSCLSDYKCWLVCNQVLEDPLHNLSPDLLPIGLKIAAKCKGLPLAAKAVGGLLRKSINVDHWTNVLESDMWSSGNLLDQILPAMRVSYDHLQLTLKRCFAYCSLFPKGFTFQKLNVVRLWMAQGFIEKSGKTGLEDVGCEYFDELVERCFFQKSPYYDPAEGMYVLHDLYHELAQSVSNKECVVKNQDYKEGKEARHSLLVLNNSCCEELLETNSFYRKDLRTILLLDVGEEKNENDTTHFQVKIPRDFFIVFDCLRALDLSNTSIDYLPDSIGNLIHLRYLSLQNTELKYLPETISGLFNLQTINLKQCYNLSELPRGIKLLSDLRYLELPLKENSNLQISSGISELVNLQALPVFSVGTGINFCGIEELGELANLKGELQIIGINRVTNAELADGAELKNKGKLKKLTLQWSRPNTNTHDLFVKTSEIFERLQPHPNLEELIVKNFFGNKFPKWLETQHLLKLTALELKNCEEIQQLPSLGQLPNLKHLLIQSARKVQILGREFIGCKNKGFPLLETLKIRKMDEWEEWGGIEEGDFAKLKYLTLKNCSKLKVIPFFGTLSKLKIKSCEKLNDLLDLSCVVSPLLTQLQSSSRFEAAIFLDQESEGLEPVNRETTVNVIS
ncbi:hypothetical protein LUZ60_003045 [Juncus effusus]|nr:hypothetical protein LUZ60_003045 [Juncus effusus]